MNKTPKKSLRRKNKRLFINPNLTTLADDRKQCLRISMIYIYMYRDLYKFVYFYNKLGFYSSCFMYEIFLSQIIFRKALVYQTCFAEI